MRYLLKSVFNVANAVCEMQLPSKNYVKSITTDIGLDPKSLLELAKQFVEHKSISKKLILRLNKI